MTLRDIFQFLFKWQRSIVSLTLIVFVLVSVLAYLIPPRYEAVARVIVEGSQSPTLAEKQSGQVDIAALLQTEVEILLSRPVMESVIDDLGLDAPNESKNIVSSITGGIARLLDATGLVADPDNKEKWIRGLLDDTEAEFGANSQALYITYTNQDPQVAAEIANAVTTRYVSYRLEVRKSEGLTSFYSDQAIESKERLDLAVNELDVYRSKYALGAITESRQSQGRALAELIEAENRLRRDHIGISDKFGPNHVNSTRSLREIEQTRMLIRELRQSLAELEQQETVIANMRALIEAEQETYLNYLALSESAKVSALTNPSTTNVLVIEYASVPQEPRASRMLLITIGLFGGFALGVAVAMIREYFDNRAIASADVEEILGIPVFTVLAASDLTQSH